ncbi:MULTISPECIES: flavin reductase family protein [Leeuwenhoekiella]|uniref:Flavin reductase (DIM6/NTAB) family NADH-FMN oxidoreductase RutF n=1 Tax=Leeuwenhoekiella palythoae TaxID=573501 RepID=A0A1M5YZK4_9FLAO|nr:MULTISPECIES: flavin reductase [Leeuwenhoekiella]MAS20295.1 flavin oxidoreductase [Leeuwenhoekiella sp.]MEC7784696.1 flavin reductase [Bacteroidota bacterium]MBH12935.1 flavin oxidoreductase [Leeuwenhoekiella sp.]MEE3147201.1 flavin reductase [Bacteroidota bacterium]MEE3227228.1 flavin reductase [Bacteroidota bacterium]|tara:strand:- start:821 stop:1468 length:648 start_codon:yes stop_codon:yes gene_type:complete
MRHYTAEQIADMPSRYRAHFINSCTGFKSANLLGSISEDGVSNVAIFSSVTHLGSNPPLLGFVLRPTSVERNTYDNLKKSGVFTVNHVNQNFIKEAHKTSAKYAGNVSEFDKTLLNEEYLDDFKAPYVKQSRIKLGCEFENEYFIKENNCHFIIGAIKHIYVDREIQAEDGWLNLERAQTVCIDGLDGYALPQILNRFTYAQPDQAVKSITDLGS